MSDTAALLGFEREKPISYTMFVLWGWVGLSCLLCAICCVASLLFV